MIDNGLIKQLKRSALDIGQSHDNQDGVKGEPETRCLLPRAMVRWRLCCTNGNDSRPTFSVSQSMFTPYDYIVMRMDHFASVNDQNQ